MRPAQLHLVRQIDPVHDAGKPDVGKNHGHVVPTQQHGCEGRFRALAFDGVKLAFLEQRRR